LTERDSERGNTSRGNRRGRSRPPAQQGARCDAGLDPRTLESQPGLKANA